MKKNHSILSKPAIKTKGFTLLEVLVVIALIGLIGSIRLFITMLSGVTWDLWGQGHATSRGRSVDKIQLCEKRFPLEVTKFLIFLNELG